VRVGTAETLHVWRALVDAGSNGLELSLKLYHAREFQLDYQQLVTEAPQQTWMARACKVLALLPVGRASRIPRSLGGTEGQARSRWQEGSG
jgi:hypothetical protein